MQEQHIGIIMNGVTGRMGTNQHLLRSILAIREEGGLRLADGTTILPDPILVGRNEEKLKVLGKTHGGLPWSTDLDLVLGDPSATVYFDSQTTDRRVEGVKRAIAAGKHVYCEKPTATVSSEALELYHLAEAAGIKHGVVQDKLWLPGLLKLRKLIDAEFFGRILSVRGEFGYWVFDGRKGELQRPSWNYRFSDGGGMILDMFCHWRYVIDNLFGNVTALTCIGANHIPVRWDENREPYAADADDAAYGTLLTTKGVICQFNMSWATRVNREDLFVMQVDGTHGSAVVGLRDVKVQSADDTPRAVWNPDIPSKVDYRAGWTPVGEDETYGNAFRAQWELFLRHVAANEPFPWTLEEGAKGVQLAELAIDSWDRRAWVDVGEMQ
jgi:predicted dehydrogenase